VPISPVPAAELGQIQRGHRVQHHEHQIVLGQPLAHVRRHQQRLITLRINEVLRHKPLSRKPALTSRSLPELANRPEPERSTVDMAPPS
jgi:hypothetical protein